MTAGSCPVVYQVLYASRTNPALPRTVDLDILHTAWERNNTMALTGFLMRIGERYFQLLEGPPEAVSEVMTSIRADDRHSDVQVLSEGEAEQRRFSKWLMAYEDASDDDEGRMLQGWPIAEGAAETIVGLMQKHSRGRAPSDMLRKPMA